MNEAMMTPSMITKRDGRVVPFDVTRIERAMTSAFRATGVTPRVDIGELVNRVLVIVSTGDTTPSVEVIQDTVERVLQAAGEYDTARNYILYRETHRTLRRERPVPEYVCAAFDESAAYFPTVLQQFQFYDKYSRFNEALGRRETWIETVDRAVDQLYDLAGSRIDRETYERIRRSILEMRAMPSMRLLAMAGPAIKRNNISLYNCAYMPVDALAAFSEALLISMSGCGVGYSVEHQYVELLPHIQRQKKTKPQQFTIPDTTEGWQQALSFGIETWFQGRDVVFDYSQIRPMGAVLRVKGGRASGPEPLRKMLTFVRDRILARQDNRLRTLDAHDIMCAIGGAAVSGGVRRTAMLSLFDWNDQSMRLCKNGDLIAMGQTQRWNANNSAVWPDESMEQIDFIQQFLEMYRGNAGEPGIFSRKAAYRMSPIWRTWRGKPGTNPCVTGDTWIMTDQGPRQVQDLRGQCFRALVDGAAWESTMDGFWWTGTKSVYEIETVEGYKLKATADHPICRVIHEIRKIQRFAWTPAIELQPGDLVRLHNHRNVTWEGMGSWGTGWLLGNLVGNGTFTITDTSVSAQLRYWGDTSEICVDDAYHLLMQEVGGRSDLKPVWNKANAFWQLSSVRLARVAGQYGIFPRNKVIGSEVEAAGSDFYAGFLRGLFDADGTVIHSPINGSSIRLSQSNEVLLEAVQRMLLRLGIASTVYRERRGAGMRLMPDGHGKHREYWCQANHELVIRNENMRVFAQVIGFSKPDKNAKMRRVVMGFVRQPNRERFSVRVKSVTYIGEEDVFDCSIPGVNAFDANGLYVHNCGEILLEPMQFCNLSMAVARPEDTEETLRDKVEVATIIGTIQSLATHFPGLRWQWEANCKRDRLLGVDITGQMDSPVAQDELVKARLRQWATATNQHYAEQLNINRAAAITCVKPSGNSSQLLDCASGLHARHGTRQEDGHARYIRNVRVATTSPLYRVFRDVGVPMHPENGESVENALNWVIHFPVEVPAESKLKCDMSAIEQLEFWLQNKLHWTHHNPSCTITYKPDEMIKMMSWVWEKRDLIGGLSFLPDSGFIYEQPPYQECTKDEYDTLVAQWPTSIDFSKIYRYEEEDWTTATQELACFAGSCELNT